jgi:hypothetical protein
MNQDKEIRSTSSMPTAFAVIFAIGLCILGYLYYEEVQKNPKEKVREIIKEVPVEKVKEVIKEVEKEIKVPVEVPAKLSKYEQILIGFAQKWLSAKRVTDLDEVFYGIKAFNTQVIFM